MATIEEEIAQATKETFSGLSELVVSELQGGGSDRRYFRVKAQGLNPSTMVVMTYTDARPDNLKFIRSTETLLGLGVRVPKIFHHDVEAMLVWIEDLGDDDLWDLRDADWESRQPFYEAVLREVAQLHRTTPQELSPEAREGLEPPFDEALYLWEQEYFFEHFVSRLSGLSPSGVEALIADPGLAEIIKILAKVPRRLLHRDFQSQNVLLPEGKACIIDHQGLRAGLPEYDLASLLLDPYVEIPPHGLAALRDFHFDLVYGGETDRGDREGAKVTRAEIDQRFRLCAAQRLMQALGAYGNLGLNLGKPRFLDHVPVARKRLLKIAKEEPLLVGLLVLDESA